MNHNKRSHLLHRDVVLSTFLTFVILLLLKLVFVNTKYLDPMYQALSDFQFTDLYYSQYQKQKTAIDTNVVIINIGNNDRAAIIEQLRLVKAHHPKVIAVDITFIQKKDMVIDSALKVELHDNSIPIILTNNIVYADESKTSEYFVESSNAYFGKKADEGYGNFLAQSGQSVRYFTPFLEINGEKHSAFSTKIIEAFDTTAYTRLKERHQKTEIINYQTAAIPKIDVGDMQTIDLDFIKGKIVLMGYMGPDLSQIVFEDNHVTPLNKSYGGHSIPDTYGVEIHANIVSMALRNDYVTEVPKWVTFAIAFLICGLHMYIFIHLYVEHHKWFHLGAKIMQIGSFALLIFLCLAAFHSLRLKLEPTYILAGVLLSCDALYFYEGGVEYMQDKFNFKSYFKKYH